MPASSGATSALDVKVYIDVGFDTQAPTWAELTNASDGLIVAGNLLDDVTEVGAITAEGTSIEYFPFGQDTSKRIPGVASLQSITFTFVVDESDTAHAGLINATRGTNYGFAFVKETSSTAQTAYFMLGGLSGRDNSMGSNSEPASCTLTFELSQNPLRVVQA